MNYSLRLLTFFSTIAVLIVACAATSGDGDSKRGNDDGSGDTSVVDTDMIQDGGGNSGSDSDGDRGCAAMDILFIIDDSGSMSCEQSMLGMAFGGFISVLEKYSNDNANEVSYRVGVTSTGRTVNYLIVNNLIPFDIPMNEVGMNGRLKRIPSEPNPWIDGPDASKDMPSLFTQLASLGTGGPSYEMPLSCMTLALEKMVPSEPNEGFLRPNALFVVVIITDEDDCSHPEDDNNFNIPDDNCMSAPKRHNLVPLEVYKQMLDDRFGTRGYVVVTIAGRTSCDLSGVACDADDPYSGAMMAKRLTDFTENYVGTGENQNGVFADICTSDMPTALEQALDKMAVVCDEYVPII